MSRCTYDSDPESKVKKRRDVKIARMTRGNRDQLVPQVYAWLKESLGFAPPGLPASFSLYEYMNHRLYCTLAVDNKPYLTYVTALTNF